MVDKVDTTSLTNDSKQNPVQTVSTVENRDVGCKYMSRCPIIRNGGIRCHDSWDCKTYDYLENGSMRID